MLGIELDELEAVTCCGAGDIHEAEPDYYLHLNARILAYGEATGADTLMTICNVCTLNLRQANWQLKNDEALLERVNRNLAAVGVPPYSGNIDVRHLLWLIAEGDGYERLKEVAHRGLKGLKVAPFYGCQILRPSKILGFEDPDRPWSLEAIIEACGGESIDYPAKIKCCGFPIIQAREDVALGELIQPIEQAKDAGADAMVTPCPLCHLSLDAWQSKLKKATGTGVRHADPAPLAADRRGGRPRGVGAPVQAARRVGQAGHRQIRGVRPLAAAAAAGLALGPLRGGMGQAPRAPRSARGLPEELAGLRIAHLSDFHLGLPSRGERAVERAVDWVVERQPDLTLISGDLVSRPRGERKLLELLERLPPATRCSATTIWRIHATRSDGAPVRSSSGRRRCSRTTRGRSSSAGGGCRSRASTRGPTWPGSRTPTACPTRRRPAHPPLPLPGGDRQAKAGLIPPRARGTPARGPDLRAVPRRALRLAHLRWRYIRGPVRAAGRDAAPLARPRYDVRSVPFPGAAGGDRAHPRIGGVSVTGLTGATLPTAPAVCHDCIFWQSPRGRSVDKRRWIEKTEDEWGAWGTVYHDADGRLLGSMQYGPAPLFPRAYELPGGPPSDDAVLVTCAYLMDDSSPWVMQSLFLTAIGDAREKGAGALESFSYHYPEGESPSSASASIARSSHTISSPTSGSERSAMRAASSSCVSSSAGCSPWSRAGAREGAACGEGGARPGPSGSAAALG